VRPSLVLLLLLLSLAAACHQVLVIQHTIKPDGSRETRALMRELVVNNSSAPLNVSGITIPPRSAVLIERDVGNVYPEFLLLDVRVSYTNATPAGGVLRAGEGARVAVSLNACSLLPVAVPLIVSIPADSKIAVLYRTPPTSVLTLAGSTAYYWTLAVSNCTKFEIGFGFVSFGSFGAVRIPTVSVVAMLDIDGALNSVQRQREEVGGAMSMLERLTQATLQFTAAASGYLQNLTYLTRALNTTGAALRESAHAINATRLALDAMAAGLLALGDSARGAALALNQSALIIDYYCAALASIASALEIQSAALSLYAKSVDRALASMLESRARVAALRDRLYEARGALDRSIGALERARDSLERLAANLTEARAAGLALRALDSAIAQARALQALVDSLAYALDAAAAVMDSAALTLKYTRDELGGLAPLLNRTAASARGNATTIAQRAPPIVLNASRRLVEVSRNLSAASERVKLLAAPLYNISRTLASAGSAILSAVRDLEAWRAEQLRNLPRLGLAHAVVQNVTGALRSRLHTLELQEWALRKYRGVVNAARVELRYYIEFPIAVKNITLRLEAAAGSAERKEGGFNAAALAVALAVPPAALAARRFLRGIRGAARRSLH